jgi:cytochrome c oxidase assembly factor CtaG
MVQHLLLMMVAPPLLWLGAPLFPLLRGFPRPVRIYWFVPLLSLYTGYRLAPTLKALAPWALLMVLLFAAGVWILFQPMQMRGTL